MMVAVPDLTPSGPKGEAASRAHRVERVRHEVQERLIEVLGVRLDGRKVGIVLAENGDGLALDLVTVKIQHPFQQRGNLDRIQGSAGAGGQARKGDRRSR